LSDGEFGGYDGVVYIALLLAQIGMSDMWRHIDTISGADSPTVVLNELIRPAIPFERLRKKTSSEVLDSTHAGA